MISDAAWTSFFYFLARMRSRAGKKLIVIVRSFPSSKRVSLLFTTALEEMPTKAEGRPTSVRSVTCHLSVIEMLQKI